jgi:hypothetical protein
VPTDPATLPEQARGALYFDLGGALPLQTVELRFSSGTRVAPVRLQGRRPPIGRGAISRRVCSIASNATAR